jgi:hypothetical protein
MSEPHAAVARDCLERSAYGELAAIEPTVVLTHTTLASSILAHTSHEVVAGNYHRGADAIRDTYEAFSSSGDTPPDVIARRGVGLVVVCHDGADGKAGDPAWWPACSAALNAARCPPGSTRSSSATACSPTGSRRRSPASHAISAARRTLAIIELRSRNR